LRKKINYGRSSGNLSGFDLSNSNFYIKNGGFLVNTFITDSEIFWKRSFEFVTDYQSEILDGLKSKINELKEVYDLDDEVNHF